MAFKKPKDYDDVKVGEARILPAGGYICKILKAEETESSTHKPMLKIAFDICEGEYENYFRDLFTGWKEHSDDPNSVKWPFCGTKWVMFYDSEGKTNRDFKSLCTSLEESGTEVWADDNFKVSSLKDAKVGIIFRREENEYQNARSWRTAPCGFRSVRTIEEGAFNVPKDKPLPEPVLTDADSFTFAEEDIPF